MNASHFKYHCTLWCYLGTLLLSFYLQGQHCLNFTSQDGLPADHVTCGVQDKDGFMWLGTAGGVTWFDGRRFVDYSNRGTGSTPGSILINCIAVASNNYIWIGTEQEGLFHYDRKKDHWTRYHSSALDPYKISANDVKTIHADPEGSIWFSAGNTGLAQIELSQRTINYFKLDAFPRRNRRPNAPYSIHTSIYDQNKFIISGQGYLFEFDKNNRRFSLLPNQEGLFPEMAQEFSTHSLAQLDNGEIWIGTWINGTWKYDIEQQKLKKRLLNINKAENPWRNTVLKGADKDVWVFSRKLGVYNYNQNTDKWHFYQPQAYNRNSLIAADYTGGYIDKDNNIWIFTTKGLSLVIPEHQAFSYHDHEVENLNFFLDSHYDPNTKEYYMAFAGDHGAFKVFDADLQLKSTYNFRLDGSFQTIYKIRSIDGQIYLVSDRLFKYDKGKKALTEVKFKGLNHKGAHIDFLKDRDGFYWFLFRNKTLIRYHPQQNSSSKFTIDDHENDQNNLYRYSDIEEIGDYIWVATGTELLLQSRSADLPIKRYHLQEDQFIKVSSSSDVINKRFIEKIIKFDEQCAWLLMNKEGMIKICYDESSGQLKTVDRKNKHHLAQLQSPIDMITGDHNDYWIATHNGLIHSDEKLENFDVFNQTHGLRATQLEQGLSSSNGHLFIGMPKGFAMVNKEKLIQQRPPLSCSIIHASVDTFDLFSKDYHSFDHYINTLKFEIGSPNFQDARSTKYAHRLSPIHTEWVLTGSDQYQFQYDQLSPGDYTLEAKAKAGSAPWSEVKTLSFQISAPFWQSSWFRIFSLLLIATIAYALYKYRMNRALEQEKINTQIAQLENTALRSQMNPHFIFNSLNSIKSLMLLDRKDESIGYLTKFSKMVREVLSISQETLIPLDRELSLLSNYIDMEQLRFNDRFEYQLKVTPHLDLESIHVPPLMIQPYVENAIWHGLMHKEGKALLKIDVTKKEEYIQIIVEDNGIGRVASNKMSAQAPAYRKKQMGMKINERRIALTDQSSSIQVEDLYDQHGVASGTRVTIEISQAYD